MGILSKSVVINCPLLDLKKYWPESSDPKSVNYQEDIELCSKIGMYLTTSSLLTD